MENPWVVAISTIVIIALSAFFVAVEFALIAARRHRLEDAAATSRSARAALRSASELTVLLAGSQLGITVCTLALGAITKPAVHHWLTPVFEQWGLPLWLADGTGFVLALVVVTFLHLVVGEMAPKSWAIGHPEKSATMLAIPMRAFMVVTRPMLRALNDTANWCLRRVGVDPEDQPGASQNIDDLRHLVDHSLDVGTLDASHSAQLSGALELQSLLVGDLVRPGDTPASVGADARVADVQEASRRSGHLRIVVTTGSTATGVVHVRDTLTVDADSGLDGFLQEPYELGMDVPVHLALSEMRRSGTQLAVVTDGDRLVGVVTMADMLGRLFPRP